MLLKNLPIDLGLAVVALHKGPGGELNQVFVPHLVLYQCGQVVIRLLTALYLAT
ncbi:unannotated protein [freshwater metagenome]|uniref:Unannotated protein n=1 Tax=freshwater metagenome TaxID=449393 RepID=A0A6J6PB83_9ZZZZ